ncbi:hypothetical protein Taro_011966 [Colocasia esculenta]|uniref:Uncharacterized protein n=1 Tax=Colocasia esculenta TaxID=4460 RepID=A0A843U2S9_COLES|nr:hypothetical protein [Colocasia esculenta]
MMDARIRAIVEAIHASPTRSVVYLAGGASQVLGWLLSVPGASSTVLEAVVPYSRTSMSQLLGKVPAHFTNQHTAEEMAITAYNRALKLSQPGLFHYWLSREAKLERFHLILHRNCAPICIFQLWDALL